MPRSDNDQLSNGFFFAAMMFLKFGNRGSAAFSVTHATAGSGAATLSAPDSACTTPLTSEALIST